MHPSLFQSTIAIEPVTYPFSPASLTSQTIAALVRMPDQFPDHESAVQFIKSTPARFFDKQVLQNLLENGFYEKKNADGETIVALKSNTLQQAAVYVSAPESLEELASRLPFITTPTLLVFAANAKWNDASTPAAVSAAVKTSESLVIPEARHMVPLESPEVIGMCFARYTVLSIN